MVKAHTSTAHSHTSVHVLKF